MEKYRDFRYFLGFPLSDVNGLKRLLLGSVLLFIPIANLWSLAYSAECMAITMKKTTPFLPEWTKWAERFKTGFLVFLIFLIYLSFPIVCALLSFSIPGPLRLFSLVSAILLGIMIPFATAIMLDKQKFRYVFDLGTIFWLLGKSLRQFIPAYLLMVAVSLISLFILLSQPFLGFAGFLFTFYVFVALSLAVGSWYGTSMTNRRTTTGDNVSMSKEQPSRRFVPK